MKGGVKRDEQRAREEQEAIDPESAREAPTAPPYSIFTRRQKRYIVFLAAFAGLFSPLSANIYFPALNTLATDLGVSNAHISLALTSYMIFQGLAPIILGDVADMAGRRLAIILCFVVYIRSKDWLGSTKQLCRFAGVEVSTKYWKQRYCGSGRGNCCGHRD